MKQIDRQRRQQLALAHLCGGWGHRLGVEARRPGPPASCRSCPSSVCPCPVHQLAALQPLRLPLFKPKGPLLLKQLLPSLVVRRLPAAQLLLLLALVAGRHRGQGQRRGTEGVRPVAQLLQRPVLLPLNLQGRRQEYCQMVACGQSPWQTLLARHVALRSNQRELPRTCISDLTLPGLLLAGRWPCC